METIIARLTKNASTRPGDKVAGEYCGIQFTGSLNKNVRPTPDYKNMIYTVDLDNEIDVFGKKRTNIEVWTNDENNTIFLVKHVH